MARPRLPFRTDHPRLMRGRETLADLLHPGGIPTASEVQVAVPQVEVEVQGALIDRLAERDVPLQGRLTLHGPLIRELAGVLTDAEEAQLLDVIGEGGRAHLDGAHPLDRRMVLIGYGLARGLLDLEARTGLTAAMPPHDVHAMTHAEWAAGGDPWYADMIDGALAECGLSLSDGARVLDFGCSSGRVVRMLAARRPQSSWLGCDVNAAAINWATGAIPEVEFTVQPLRPPLPYSDGSLDAAYAISIWSHYAEAPARVWLDELHRVIRPGGLALITTHGPGAIAYRSNDPNHGEATQRQPLVDLYRSGFSFVDAFGEAGDWGVVDREWGVSFISPEWMLREITPQWSVALYRPAAIDAHQDLWVLRREA
ncbi:MAG: class I SAM-dependent methyltransferase [Solirubrobacteraceae bacterium]|nr:class I SAM-dependent methyltransferase [Solirubrobacteraceae bacterium]